MATQPRKPKGTPAGGQFDTSCGASVAADLADDYTVQMPDVPLTAPTHSDVYLHTNLALYPKVGEETDMVDFWNHFMRDVSVPASVLAEFVRLDREEEYWKSQARNCSNGHEMPEEDQFCTTCGGELLTYSPQAATTFDAKAIFLALEARRQFAYGWGERERAEQAKSEWAMSNWDAFESFEVDTYFGRKSVGELWEHYQGTAALEVVGMSEWDIQRRYIDQKFDELNKRLDHQDDKIGYLAEGIDITRKCVLEANDSILHVSGQIEAGGNLLTRRLQKVGLALSDQITETAQLFGK